LQDFPWVAMADAPHPHSFSFERSPSAACSPRPLSPCDLAMCLRLCLGFHSLLWPLLFVSDARPSLCGEVRSDTSSLGSGQSQSLKPVSIQLSLLRVLGMIWVWCSCRWVKKHPLDMQSRNTRLLPKYQQAQTPLCNKVRELNTWKN